MPEVSRFFGIITRMFTETGAQHHMRHYVVADPRICHGKPTFRGTRIMVWQVLEMVADGMAWETIVKECHNSITEEAIAEAVQLASKSFLEHAHEHELEPVAA